MADHDWPWVRVTGILGIVFFVAVAVGLSVFIPLQPTPSDPIADIREFVDDDGTLVAISNWILGVGLLFAFLPFAAGLRSVLSRTDVDAGMWTRSAYGAAVALVAVTGAGTAFMAGVLLAFDSGELSDGLLRAMFYADAYIYSVIVSFGIAFFLAANGLVILRTGTLWKWLAWYGLVVAALSLIGAWWPLDGDPEGILAFLAFLSVPLLAIWTLLAGINLLRSPAAAAD